MLKLNIDEQGAVVTRAELIKERQEADWTEVGLAGMILGKTPKELKNIVLFNVTPKHVYVAQSGLIGGNFPNHKTRFKYLGTTQSKKQDAELGREVTVHTAAFEATEGMVTVRKSYELKRENELILNDLNNDSLVIDRIARERYNMHREDEDLFLEPPR